jgi:hypothetical protein
MNKMEAQLQQYPVQEALIPLLTESELLTLSMCSTKLGRVCEEWIQKITIPESDDDDLLYDYCRDNKIISLRLLIEKYKDELDWSFGLVSACGGGNRSVVELMIQKGATNWNWALENACSGGHLEIVELLIEKGATNWNNGLWMACIGESCAGIDKQPEIIKLMIEKGATKCCCDRSLDEHHVF